MSSPWVVLRPCGAADGLHLGVRWSACERRALSIPRVWLVGEDIGDPETGDRFHHIS